MKIAAVAAPPLDPPAPARKAFATALRKKLPVSLDNPLARGAGIPNPNVSRPGSDRCLRRRGAGNLRASKAKAAEPKLSTFKAYRPCYPHVDLDTCRHMPMRWAFVGVFTARTAADALRFLRDPKHACAIRIQATILAGQRQGVNGSPFGLRKLAAPARPGRPHNAVRIAARPGRNSKRRWERALGRRSGSARPAHRPRRASW